MDVRGAGVGALVGGRVGALVGARDDALVGERVSALVGVLKGVLVGAVVGHVWRASGPPQFGPTARGECGGVVIRPR